MRGSCGHLPLNAAGWWSVGPFPARFTAEKRSDWRATVRLKGITCPVFGRDDAPGHLPPEKRNRTARRDLRDAPTECNAKSLVSFLEDRGHWEQNSRMKLLGTLR
eukprot:superscaffoldBa00000931_g8064